MKPNHSTFLSYRWWRSRDSNHLSYYFFNCMSACFAHVELNDYVFSRVDLAWPTTKMIVCFISSIHWTYFLLIICHLSPSNCMAASLEIFVTELTFYLKSNLSPFKRNCTFFYRLCNNLRSQTVEIFGLLLEKEWNYEKRSTLLAE